MDLLVIENRLKAIDVTKIAQYTAKIKDIGTLNKMMAPTYMRDFIIAYDITNSALASAVKCDLQAHTELKNAEAIAYLDKAGDYLSSKGIKDSSEARKRYIDVDPDVLAAKELKAKSEAMTVFLKNKLQAFRISHDDVKKIAYSDNYMTNEEGFGK